MDEVKAFEQASLRGDYYEPLSVDSRNFMETTEATAAWIAECVRLFDRCVEESRTRTNAETCQA